MDLQEIKNYVFGKDIVAIEIYPKAEDFKDGSNTYHLWTWEEIESQVPNLAKIEKYY